MVVLKRPKVEVFITEKIREGKIIRRGIIGRKDEGGMGKKGFGIGERNRWGLNRGLTCDGVIVTGFDKRFIEETIVRDKDRRGGTRGGQESRFGKR